MRIKNRCGWAHDRRLQFEALEERRLLAVTLELSSGIAITPVLDSGGLPINVNVSGPSGQPSAFQSEMTLDVNPRNPLNIAGFSHKVASSDPSINTDIDVFYGLDGGISWDTTPINDTTDPTGSADTRFDPSITFDADGNLYVAYGHSAGSTDKIVVAKSTNGGESFSQFVPAYSDSNNRNVDKWHLATGLDPTTGNQAVYVAYSDVLSSIDHDIMVAASNDGGASFPTRAKVNDTTDDSDNLLFADPAVGPNGELYVSWYDTTNGVIYFDSDLDGLFSATKWCRIDVYAARRVCSARIS